MDPLPMLGNANAVQAALRNWVINLNKELAGTGVYAGHVAINVWIGEGVVDGPEGSPTATPEQIAPPCTGTCTKTVTAPRPSSTPGRSYLRSSAAPRHSSHRFTCPPQRSDRYPTQSPATRILIIGDYRLGGGTSTMRCLAPSSGDLPQRRELARENAAPLAHAGGISLSKVQDREGIAPRAVAEYSKIALPVSAGRVHTDAISASLRSAVTEGGRI
ncbi:hypothetical protein ABT299_39925 [Spirillospora sp. NPDC000708]